MLQLLCGKWLQYLTFLFTFAHIVSKCYLHPCFIPPPLSFLMQCSPEYKLSGLYVVDSIVRQSRHQFGTEKDVYGPRFSKNLEKTFKNLFMCTQSDQVSLVRHALLPARACFFPKVLIMWLIKEEIVLLKSLG